MPSTPSRPRRSRWTSFVAETGPSDGSERARILHEEGNPSHRLRVEHDQDTLLVHLADEDGHGWTVLAVDRRSRRWALAQGPTQQATAQRACTELDGLR